MWISKIGNVGKPLLLGLLQNEVLVTFGSLTDPTLRIRRKGRPLSEAMTFVVTTYTDPDTPARFNAQYSFSNADFALPNFIAGDYIADVSATFGGVPVRFPEHEYIELRFLRGVV